MPIHLDHAERRSRLAAAVWRIVLREGMRGASVRGVAREAELSMGSVRHFFATQDQLLQFAMREVIEKVSARIQAGIDARPPMTAENATESMIWLLEQVLPLDDERLTEARVWAVFAGQASTDPGMTAIRREADSGLQRLCRNCLTGLSQFGKVAPGRNLEVETERLWSLLDGLTMHILLDPVSTPLERVDTVLRTHLRDLVRD